MDKITDGLKHDGGKPRLSLVPGEAIEAIGAVMTHGAEKYKPNSWRQVNPERYRDALMRHICKWLKDPHGLDDDSGLPHLWHIITNAAFLCVLDGDDSQEMEMPYIVAHSNINLAKEELETLKDILTKQALDVGLLITNIWVLDKEEKKDD